MTVLLCAGIAGIVTFSDPRRLWQVGLILGALCIALAMVLHG